MLVMLAAEGGAVRSGCVMLLFDCLPLSWFGTKAIFTRRQSLQVEHDLGAIPQWRISSTTVTGVTAETRPVVKTAGARLDKCTTLLCGAQDGFLAFLSCTNAERVFVCIAVLAVEFVVARRSTSHGAGRGDVDRGVSCKDHAAVDACPSVARRFRVEDRPTDFRDSPTSWMFHEWLRR